MIFSSPTLLRARELNALTPAEKAEAARKYEIARRQVEQTERMLRFATRIALAPLAESLLQAEQDDGVEELDEDDIETHVDNAAPEECPPTLRACELYPSSYTEAVA